MTTTRMASADAAWLGIDAPDNLMMVTAVLRLHGRVDWRRFADEVAQRIVARYPTFRLRAVRRPGPLGSVWSDDLVFDSTRMSCRTPWWPAASRTSPTS